MKTVTIEKPKVTIIACIRERFSCTRQFLENIYKNTDYPFELVYVDIGSPAHIQRYLQGKAQEKQFKLLNTGYYASPNQAKNVGLLYVLGHSEPKYIVFIENDVTVKRGWLTKLVACAEETGAAVVGPLTCIGKPEHQVIHNAGGHAYIVTEVKNDQIRRRIRQQAYLTGKTVAKLTEQLHRTRCDYVEFHCMLAKTEIFEKEGLLDEGMLASREHIDFCLTVSQAGGAIFSEREAVVTTDALGIGSNKIGLGAWFGYLQIPNFEWSDLPYFMLRWSDAWDLASLHRLRDKWELSEDKYFQKRYRGIGSRRHELLIQPLVRRLTFGQGSAWLEKLLIFLERKLNQYVYRCYVRRMRVLNPQKVNVIPKKEEEKEVLVGVR